MKKKVIVICSIVLAVCIGLGIPLVTASIQDSAVLNRKESLSDADAALGLNGRVPILQAKEQSGLDAAAMKMSNISRISTGS